jgi:hypothetical protein
MHVHTADDEQDHFRVAGHLAVTALVDRGRRPADSSELRSGARRGTISGEGVPLGPILKGRLKPVPIAGILPTGPAASALCHDGYGNVTAARGRPSAHRRSSQIERVSTRRVLDRQSARGTTHRSPFGTPS